MLLNNINFHKYHIVDVSPWPIAGAFSGFFLTIGLVFYMHKYDFGLLILIIGVISLLLTMYLWWRDIIRESTFLGKHTLSVQLGLKIGVILFIISEILFFISFFWAYFHSSIAPTLELGCIWPPIGIDIFNPYKIPLLNTSILILSGITVTYTHHCLIVGYFNQSKNGLLITIILALIFTLLQLLEYLESPFNISDSSYGSSFFIATGFHGFHVIIGTIFLIVCFLRKKNYQYTRQRHIGFEFAAWYWHFVDVIWLFLYLSIYLWGISNNIYYDYFQNYDTFLLLNEENFEYLKFLIQY